MGSWCQLPRAPLRTIGLENPCSSTSPWARRWILSPPSATFYGRLYTFRTRSFSTVAEEAAGDGCNPSITGRLPGAKVLPVLAAAKAGAAPTQCIIAI
eukprot:scaffold132305_cov63-Phaeocystis_antarctica.AAC.2